MKIYIVIKQHYDLAPGTRLSYCGPCTTEPDSLLLQAIQEPLDTAPLFIVPLSKLQEQHHE